MAKKAVEVSAAPIEEAVVEASKAPPEDLHESLRRLIEVGDIPPDRVNEHGAKLRAVLQGTGTNQEIVLAAVAAVKELSKDLK